MEERNDVFVNFFKIFQNSSCRCSYHIFSLGHANSLKFDARLVLNVLNKMLSLVRVERDTSARSSSSCCTSCSVDVNFSFFRWLNLYDEVNIRYVKASGSNVSGAEHSELALLEALHCDFTLILSNVSMHNFDVLLNFVSQNERVAVSLCLREYNRLAVDASIADQDVSQSGNTVLEGTADCEMLYITGGLVF